MIPLHLCALLLATTAASLPAQILLKDINAQPPTTDPGSLPAEFHTAGAQTFFQAADAAHGAELWVTDGTSAGTRLVLDLEPGDAGSSPRGFTTFGSVAFFTAETSGHGMELWRSDGTAAGTRLVADLNPGPAHAAPDDYEVVGTRMFFRATASTVGRELFVTDGTPAGTQLVLDIWPGTSDSGPLDLVELGGALLFSAEEPMHGRELWVSDGTPAGTKLLLDIEPGATSGFPRGMVRLGTQILFSAGTAVAGIELWHSDGTAAGTTLLADLNSGTANSHPFFLVPIGGLVWFQADDGLRGDEVWVSDGTAAGTRLVADVYPGSTDSRPEHFTAFGTQVLFIATAAGAGREVHISDGTAAGTRLVADVRPGTAASMTHPSSSAVFHVAGYRAVFTADDGVHGVEPWSTDGTAAGTVLLADVNPGNANGSTVYGDELAALGPHVLFRGYEPTSLPLHGAELWRTDGTPGGTALLRNLQEPLPNSSSAISFAELLGRVLFFADDGVLGFDPWVSDGTAAGTSRLADIGLPPPFPSVAADYFEFGDHALFTILNVTYGREPWITDGTTAGTKLLLDIRPGGADSGPADWALFQGRVFFSAADPTYGRELWVTDGTTAGTRLFADLWTGSSSSGPGSLTVAGDLLYFAAVGWTNTVGLWRSDGTAAGTILVRPFLDAQARIHEIAAFGSGLILGVEDGTYGLEPWISDGTPAGTKLLADLRAGVKGSSAAGFILLPGAPDRIVFRADDGVQGIEPWVTDGTAAGTMLLRDIGPGSEHSNPGSFVVAGGRVYFIASDRSAYGTGRELWSTDGTPAGTKLVLDLWPGPADGVAAAHMTPLHVAGDNVRILFGGHDGQTGVEPWVSDGTPSGTRRVADLRPGPSGSNPGPFAVVGTRVYFAAYGETVGREPFWFELSQIGAGYARGFGAGCRGSSGDVPLLSSTGAPVLGSSDFLLALSRAKANSPACALVGLGPTPIDAGSGCTVYFPMAPLLAYPLLVDAAGNAVQAIPIANDPRLLGFFAHAQAFVSDPGAAWQGAVAFTNGLQVVVGN